MPAIVAETFASGAMDCAARLVLELGYKSLQAVT